MFHVAFDCGFDDVINSIIVDYTCGSTDFWRWRYRACIRDVFDKLRTGETYWTYENRTGISNGTLWTDAAHRPVDRSPTDITQLGHCFDDGRDNIIYIELFNYFGEYEYDYAIGTDNTRLIYDYLGWFYGWKSDTRTSEQPSLVPVLDMVNRSLESYRLIPRNNTYRLTK